MTSVELREKQLADELEHTLKLVPQSQRETFVFELAVWSSVRDHELLDEVERRLPERKNIVSPPDASIAQWNVGWNEAISKLTAIIEAVRKDLGK